MELGADYSYARPGGAALKAAGVVAVGRYLADDDRGITTAEYQELLAYGIGVWLTREGRANGMLGGFNQGSADGQIAVQQIALVGLPAGAVVFATADFDVETDAQFAACDDYLRGFASVLGVARVGIYGGLHYLNHAYQAGLATHFWQAGATSWDHGEQPLMKLDFHQTTQTPPVPGTDHNYVLDASSTTLGVQETTLEDDVPNIYEIVAGRTDTSGSHYLSVNRAMRYGLSKQSEADYQFWLQNTLGYTPAQVAVKVVDQLASFGPVIQDATTPAPAPAVDLDALAQKIVAALPAATVENVSTSDIAAAVAAEIRQLSFKAE